VYQAAAKCWRKHEAKQIHGITPLLAAASSGHTECIELLLDAGSDKEAKQIDGFTPLLMTAQKGYAKCLQLLLNAGADKEATTKRRSTALLIAAQYGHLECIKLLLKAGCNVHALNILGASALVVAVENNHVDCVRTPVQAGADITIEVDRETIEDILKRTNNGDELRTALLSTAKKRRRCEQCGTTTTGQKMLKCGACLTTHYCNRECQTANWPLHKQVCNAEDLKQLDLKVYVREVM
jgi:ankyrin repeat protein